MIKASVSAILLTLSAHGHKLVAQEAPMRYQSQEQCDELASYDGKFSYKFIREACTCFFEFSPEVDFDPKCYGDKPKFNPLHQPYNKDDLCISVEDFDRIFEHGLDRDCLEQEAMAEEEADTGADDMAGDEEETGE